MKKYLIGAALSGLLLGACSAPAVNGEAQSTANQPNDEKLTAALDTAKLEAVMADPRRDKDRARDGFRHTAQTMAFFDIAPNANVVEALPGGGWYTRVLLPYVSPDGGWYGINYSPDLRGGIMAYSKREFSDEARETYTQWPEKYPEMAKENGPENAAVKGAFLFGMVPDSADGQMDAVLFIRALHHLNRIDPKYFAEAIADSYAMLKPGGIVGVVQHRAKEDYGDKEYDVSGHKGFLKQSYVIEMFKKGGFELDGISEVNANPKDTADYERGVWTLPPTLAIKDDAMKEHYRQIGESDRMTLRFRKPS